MTTGTLYSYSLTTGMAKPAISDVINMIDWTEAPLLRLLGFSEANRSKFKIVNWPATTVKWIEDTMPVFRTTLGTGGGGDGSGTSITVASGHGPYFRQGDVVAVSLTGAPETILEKYLVTSVSGDVLTVERGFGSTSTVTTAVDGSYITILTRAMPEAANYTTGYTTATTIPENYSQIISEAVQVSETQRVIQKFGIADMMDYQVSKLFADGGAAGRLAQFLERTFYFGEKVARDASNYGSMGGFKTFVTTNVANKAGAAITRADIHTKIRQIRTAGGKVTHLVTGAWGIEKITGMYEDLITTRRDEKLGGSEITSILTPHGKVDLVFDWMCPETDYYFINKEKCGWLPIREFTRGEIARQGDYHVTDVVGEFTFALTNEKSHGYIYGAATDK
jgi:hypothetical protein